MITVLNEVVASEIKGELARRSMSQLDLAIAIGKRPEYVQRRLSGSVELSVTDVELIGGALGVNFLQLPRTMRRAS